MQAAPVRRWNYGNWVLIAIKSRFWLKALPVGDRWGIRLSLPGKNERLLTRIIHEGSS
jgi:hypothetical protein